MLFTGLAEEGWEDYFYTSVEEITSPEKVLARWEFQHFLLQPRDVVGVHLSRHLQLLRRAIITA